MKKNLKDYLQNEILVNFGQRVLLQRKKLKVTAEGLAISAGISRVTLHRIEKGDPGVSVGAYVSVLQALDMQMTVELKSQHKKLQAIDLSKIAIKNYPELKKLSWQLKDDAVLSALEAKNIYERNERFISFSSLCDDEKELIDQLGIQFSEGK